MRIKCELNRTLIETPQISSPSFTVSKCWFDQHMPHKELEVLPFSTTSCKTSPMAIIMISFQNSEDVLFAFDIRNVQDPPLLFRGSSHIGFTFFLNKSNESRNANDSNGVLFQTCQNV